jgi:mannose-6-phosphate isomerase-like protein (cupin superfamily)
MGEAPQVKALPSEPTVVAPDGSDVRVLVGLARGSMAHFELGPGDASVPVRHRTVEEVWYFVAGTGEMWLNAPGGQGAEPLPVGPGTSLAIPVGTIFQFRNTGTGPLEAVGVTMPPWPGPGEAELMDGGPWVPTVEPGPT